MKARNPKTPTWLLDLILGPISATVILIMPGIFAALWDFGFWVDLLTGTRKFSWGGPGNTHDIWYAVGLFAMAFLFPIAAMATGYLWHLAWLGPDRFSHITNRNRQIAITVLILAIIEAIWIIIGMPFFNSSNVSFTKYYLILLGPIYLGAKYIVILWQSDSRD